MRAVRAWSVRHSVPLKRTYDFGLRFLPALRLLMRLTGTRRLDRVFRPLERALKGLMFDCKMCGQCVLSSTGMACPTNCAKGMRNGPCGGVRANGNCEVIPDMRCVWVEAAAGRSRLKKAGIPSVTTLPPLDYRLFNTSSWVAAAGLPSPEALVSGALSQQQRDGIVAVGNFEVHSFEAACKSDRFVVTVEIAPPDTADSRVLLERAAPFRNLADAVNITDGVCFDLEALSRFMQQVRARGLHRRAAIIVGVGTLNSAKALSRMRNVVPGVHIPQSVIERIAAASDQIAAGQRVLVENLRAIAAIEGVAGVHLMGFKNERVLAQAIVQSGVREARRAGFPSATAVQFS
jgi:hypothetical protein